MNVYTAERVQLDLSREDFNHLLIVLGSATGAFAKDGARELMRSTLRLANTINEGNPCWTPYELASEQAKGE